MKAHLAVSAKCNGGCTLLPAELQGLARIAPRPSGHWTRAIRMACVIRMVCVLYSYRAGTRLRHPTIPTTVPPPLPTACPSPTVYAARVLGLVSCSTGI